MQNGVLSALANGRLPFGSGARRAAAAFRTSLGTTFAASGLIQLLTIISGVILARELGPHGRGVLTEVILWPAMLAALGSIGLIEATAFVAASDTVAVGLLAGTSLAIGVMQSVILCSVGVAVVGTLLPLHGSNSDASYLYVAFIPLNLLALYLMAILNGQQRVLAFNVLRVMTILGTTAGIVGLAAAGRLTVLTAAIAYLLSTFATGVCAAILVLRTVDRLQLRFDRVVARRLGKFGVRTHVGVVASALNERLDQLLISLVLLPSRLGLYVVAVTLTSATALVGTSVSMVALPAIARASSLDERQRLARRYVTVTLLAASLASIPLLLLTPQVLEFFFGYAFVEAVPVARVLLVAGVVLSANRTLAAVLKGCGRPFESGTGELFALGITVAGLAVLLPAFGILGAGIASLAAYAASAVWMSMRVSRALDGGNVPPFISTLRPGSP